jgi:L-iditol 2-dehydrogenase
MKTIIFKSPNKIVIQDLKKPEIKDSEILIKVVYAGLCGTDIDIYQNKAHFKVEYPIICGHEWSGIIVETGKNVKCFNIGDKVVGNSEISCCECEDCLLGNYSKCNLLVGVGITNSYPGAFSEYIVMPENFVYKIPEGIPMIEAAIVEPAVISAYSVDEVGINPGEIVLISGTGAIGFFAAQYSKLKGAVVILTGINDQKLKIAEELGIDYTINIKKEDLFKRVKEITGHEEIIVSIEASGNLNALEDLVKLTGRFGKISVPGSYSEVISMYVSNLAEKNITMKFIGGTGSGNNFIKVLHLFKLKKINVNKLITEIYNIDDIERAIEMKIKPNNSIKTVLRVNGQFKE